MDACPCHFQSRRGDSWLSVSQWVIPSHSRAPVERSENGPLWMKRGLNSVCHTVAWKVRSFLATGVLPQGRNQLMCLDNFGLRIPVVLFLFFDVSEGQRSREKGKQDWRGPFWCWFPLQIPATARTLPRHSWAEDQSRSPRGGRNPMSRAIAATHRGPVSRRLELGA